MSDEINSLQVALHTAARRYCHWHCNALLPGLDGAFRYAMLKHLYDWSFPYPDALEDFMYDASSVLKSVLHQIESVDADAFPDLESLRLFLLETAQKAAEDRSKYEEFDLEAEQQFLEEYRQYVEELTEGVLVNIDPLPYRLYLAPEEAMPVWDRLEQQWDAPPDSYWYPMAEVFEERPDVVSFDVLAFYEQVGPVRLADMLRSHGVERIYQLIGGNEGDQCETDVTLIQLIPIAIRKEAYVTSRDASWVIYLSHERSITIAGAWLLEAVIHAWPQWRAGVSIFEGHRFEDDRTL